MAVRFRTARTAVILAALISASIGSHAANEARGKTAPPSPCGPAVFDQSSYTICEADLSRFAIRLFWRRPDGRFFAHLGALPKTDAGGGRLIFALNAGMFDPNYKPVGLFIESGRELVHANTKPGPGNFHLTPNGVFYGNGVSAGVLATSAFLKRRPKADFATQSGPMLVVGGKLNPRIARARESLKRRDGVCVRSGKIVIFAISREPVAFGTFAKLFRDKLLCTDALFLDGGGIPSLYLPATPSSGDSFLTLGPMIGVYENSSVTGR